MVREDVEWECSYGRREEGRGDRVDVLQDAEWEAVTVCEYVLRLLCITDCSNDW